MRISAEYLAPGPNASLEEARTNARIRIKIGERNATDMRIGNENHIVDHIVAPTYPVAEAIAFRWWQIIYGRGRKTSLKALRSGFVFPDISIMGTGNDQIEVRCVPFAYQNPNIQFVTTADEAKTIDEISDDLEAFLSETIRQLDSQGLNKTLLAEQFDRVLTSLTDVDEEAFCKAAGCLGVDPYTCDERVSALIESASKLFEDDSLEEFLAGVDKAKAIDSLEWLTSAEKQLGELTELPAIEELKAGLAYTRKSAAPWTEGYSSARKIRELMGLKTTDKILNTQNLATRLGNKSFKLANRGPSELRGVSHIVPGHARAIVNATRHSDAELFAVARTFGDAIHFGSDHYSPVTNQTATYRQQMGRAFAAEFLAPVRSVLDMKADGREDEEIANDFGVSDLVIRHQIENQHRALAA